jgi:hypothetical protein
MRRPSALVLALALVGACLLALGTATPASPAGALPAQAGVDGGGDGPDQPAPGSASDGVVPAGEVPDEGGRSIPLPNSGTPPDDAGDRGGALQVALFAALVLGLGAIGALAVRDVRRGQRRQAAAGATPARDQPSGA